MLLTTLLQDNSGGGGGGEFGRNLPSDKIIQALLRAQALKHINNAAQEGGNSFLRYSSVFCTGYCQLP